MAVGYEVTTDKRYLSAMTKAADYLLDHFSNTDKRGYWYRDVEPDGKASFQGFYSFGHSQAIFALSHAYKVSQEAKYFDAAIDTWKALDVASAINENNKQYALSNLNFSMHLFESLLVLYKVSGLIEIREDVQQLADYIVARFHDSRYGFFAEHPSGSYLRKAEGAVFPGHSAEMSFLLSRAVDAGLPARYLQPAIASVDFVAQQAATDPRGLIPHKIDESGNILDAEYYWWSQTELLRSLAHFALHRNRPDLDQQFQITLAYVKAHYIDPAHRGWYRKPDTLDQDKGQTWKVGYHVAMLLTELMRLGGMTFYSGDEILL
jgi:mannose/cellobiose epimerase-like protein (N-acyl-D-glucosamine 2-epimerase family)